jgi:hypothetical protein
LEFCSTGLNSYNFVAADAKSSAKYSQLYL